MKVFQKRKLNVLLGLFLMVGLIGLAFAPVSSADTTKETRTGGATISNEAAVYTEATGAANYLPTAVLEHSFAHGVHNNNHFMGTAYDPATDTYWTIGGGNIPSSIYQYDAVGTIITSGEVPVDGRAIVYRPEDGNIYIATYLGDIYRLTLPFDGTVTLIHPGILQDRQNGIAFANGGNIFDVFNGTVREYDFATGAVLRTFALSPNYPSGLIYPYNVQIASDGTDLYFLSALDQIYVYDINGIYQTTVSLNNPFLDNFYAPFSLSYANGRIYVRDSSAQVVLGYRIQEVVVTALTISPASGSYVTTQRFDITLIVDAPGLTATVSNFTWNGSNITRPFNNCAIAGTLLSGGETFRCSIPGSFLGDGSHTFGVTVDLSDGSTITDTATWEIKANTEP